MNHKILAALLVLCFSSFAFAEGGEGGEAAGEKAAPKPWVQAESHLSSLRGKAEQLEKTLRESIESRKNATGPDVTRLDKEIKKTYNEMRENNSELRKAEQVLKYRFPEKTAKEERSYSTQETPSLEKIEESIGVEGKLNRNLRKMRGQFGTAEQKKQAQAAAEKAEAKSGHEPEIAEKPAKKAPAKDIRDQDSVVIKVPASGE